MPQTPVQIVLNNGVIGHGTVNINNSGSTMNNQNVAGDRSSNEKSGITTQDSSNVQVHLNSKTKNDDSLSPYVKIFLMCNQHLVRLK